MSKKEEIIFDAERDNKGKGISVDKIIKILKKLEAKSKSTYKNF